MKWIGTVFIIFIFNYLAFSQLYISEVSDASAYRNEFLELYNNSNTPVDLTGYKLIRVNAANNTKESVYDFGTDESGTGSDLIIPAYGFMVVGRSNDKATFESEWGTLNANAAYNNGNTNLYFGTGTARRWRLRSNDGTFNQDDGTILDDTGQAVGGSGYRHYQKNIGGPWVQASYTSATPGALDADQSLPVSLTSFTAIAGNNQVTLKWITESEVNNVGFEIMRAGSEDGEYQVIADYRSHPELRGQFNSSQRHEYQYTDNSLLNGQTYWYKLVDVDLNGVRTFHGPLAATPNATGSRLIKNANLPDHFALHQNYPNPFNPSTTLNFDIPASRRHMVTMSLVVYNALGQQVKVLYDGDIAPGSYQLEWDGTNQNGTPLPSGIYYGVIHTDQYSHTIKMVLMK